MSGHTGGMDLAAAKQLAQQLMNQYGLTHSGWSFTFNRRKRTLGLCNYDAKRVELSQHFVICNDEQAVRDTVLHEIAHALAGHRAGHGAVWARLCRELGATPLRVCATAVMPLGKYFARCFACDREHHRHRRPMRGRRYYCRACGPEKGKLRFVKRLPK